MATKQIGKLRKVKLCDAIDEFAHVESSLLDTLKQYDALLNEEVLVCEYPYGASIVKNGVLQLPGADGQIHDINSSAIEKEIAESVRYQPIPLSLVLENASEVFIEDANSVLPLRTFKPGELFGLFELFDNDIVSDGSISTNVNAGARNSFCVPKISNKKGYKKLSDIYNTEFFIPKNYQEHYKTFSQISDLHGGIKHWKNTVLFFTKSVISKIKSEKLYETALFTILKEAWVESTHLRLQPTYNVLWNIFNEAMIARNLKPRPYIMNITKTILEITHGCLPGFSPAELDEDCLPTKLIQHVLVDEYKLDKYTPTIMTPRNFTGKQAIYLPLSYANTASQFENEKYAPSRLSDLKELYRLFETFQLSENSQNIKLIEAFKNLNIEFFHDDAKGNDIISSDQLGELDRRLNISNTAQTQFCSSSPFARGCIKISNQLSE